LANPLIQVRGLSYTYDDGTVALNGVDFDLLPGETVALLGSNGSGKTTFVLHLNGLLVSPAVTICGDPVSVKTLPVIRKRIGVVFQDSDEQLFMPTVLEDVAFGPRTTGLSAQQSVERARQSLAQVGMEASAARTPYHLSAGEKRRVAIAGVIAMVPDVLVLDEPTTFLDPPAQRHLLHLLRELPQAKIIVTHDIGFARAIATRAVFFGQGRIIAEGSVEELAVRCDWRPD